jgi:hypothetical protein
MEHAAIVESPELDPRISRGPRVKTCSRKARIVNPGVLPASERSRQRGGISLQEDSPHEIGEALAQFVNRSSALQYSRRETERFALVEACWVTGALAKHHRLTPTAVHLFNRCIRRPPMARLTAHDQAILGRPHIHARTSATAAPRSPARFVPAGTPIAAGDASTSHDQSYRGGCEYQRVAASPR